MTFLIFIVLTVLILAFGAWQWLLTQQETSRAYAEMESMTPRDAYRRELVLKYLPQCQQDMDEIDEILEKETLNG